MSGLRTRIRRAIWNRIGREFVFSPPWQEQHHRQQFFYSAFRALSFNGIDGDYAEFGCSGGRTFALAYHEAQRHRHAARLWAFDSFQGLPAPQAPADEHPLWRQGTMATSLVDFHAICAANGIPSERYDVIPGFYDQSLARLSSEDAPRNIALAYLDCDLYSSAKAALRFLLPRLKHGMIIAFDDYFCWSASQISGERKAMLEVLANDSRWGLLPYLQFGWHGNSFIIEDRRLLAPRP
jgi:O-methyltransferase